MIKDVERVYMQANKDRAALTTVMEQHIFVIGMLERVEDQMCLDYEQYNALKTELQAINKNLHALAEVVWN